MHYQKRYNGELLGIKETIRGFKEIIEGKHDDLPESAFLFVGTIDEAVAKALAIIDEKRSKIFTIIEC